MRIADLVESLDLPETRVAERAWDTARRRVRRRQGAVAAGAAALAVACVVGVTVVNRPHHTAMPMPQPSPTRTGEPRTAPLVQELLTAGHWRAELADMDHSRFSGSLDRAVPLSEDPVGRAALAMASPGNEAGAFVLGEDGRWRRVDVPGLVAVHHSGSYTSPALRPTALSPDATQLALAQPNALVVVDLTTGRSRRYDVAGAHNTYALWADDDHVLVVQGGGAEHGTLVDLHDGSLRQAPYGPSTRFLGSDSLTWGRGDELLLHSVLKWGDGRSVRTKATNSAGFFPQPPLVQGDVVVGDGGVYYDRNDGLPVNTLGITVVDGSNGEILAYLPLQGQNASAALLLGWKGDDPLIGVPIPEEARGLFVFAWDWKAGSLDPIGHVRSGWVSWGTGNVTE